MSSHAGRLLSSCKASDDAISKRDTSVGLGADSGRLQKFATPLCANLFFLNVCVGSATRLYFLADASATLFLVDLRRVTLPVLWI